MYYIVICGVFMYVFLYNFVVFLINYHVFSIYLTYFIFFCLNIRYVSRNYQYLYIFIFMKVYWCFCFLCSFFLISLLFIFSKLLYYFFVFQVVFRLNFFLIDIKNTFYDFFFFSSGFLNFLSNPVLFLERFKFLFTQFNDRRKYILKKYVYTINHKRIAINYFIFSM